MASAAVVTNPAAIAPEAKNIAMNSSPLPRKTVAKNRSSPCTDAIAQHADEPQEGDAGERQELQAQGHGLAPVVVVDPRTRVRGVRRDRPLDEDDGRREQDREDDAGDRRGQES